MSHVIFPVNPFTFGNSKAAVVLAERLSELKDVRLVNKVSSYLSNHNELVNHVATMPHRYRNSVLNMLVDRVKEYSPNWPESIVTYTKNVAMSKIKKAKEL